MVSDLLDTNGLGKNNSVDIAETLESLAMIFDSEGDLHRACEYFNASAKWFTRAGDSAKTAE